MVETSFTLDIGSPPFLARRVVRGAEHPLEHATALCISAIVPMEMRQCVFSYGGKSRPTRTPAALQASRNPAAGRLMSMKMKLVCESVPVTPMSANAFTVNAFTSVLRLRSAAMCAVLPSATKAPPSVSVPRPYGVL